MGFGSDGLGECRQPVPLHPQAFFQRRHRHAKEWDDLTFQFGPRAFLYADKDRIIGFAATPVEAEQLVTQFGQKYRKPMPPALDGGIFYLIQQDGAEIKAKEVALSSDTVLKPEAIALHYGDGSGEWHQGFVEKLRGRTNGLSILEGRPGTGKTFYLRHLMGELKESHRFYFIPTSTMGILSRPGFHRLLDRSAMASCQ